MCDFDESELRQQRSRPAQRHLGVWCGALRDADRPPRLRRRQRDRCAGRRRAPRPRLDALPPDVPPAIRALLHGCLQKDRAQRVADISTARFVIDAASSLADPPPAPPEPGTPLADRARGRHCPACAARRRFAVGAPFDPSLPASPATPSHRPRTRSGGGGRRRRRALAGRLVDGLRRRGARWGHAAPSSQSRRSGRGGRARHRGRDGTGRVAGRPFDRVSRQRRHPHGSGRRRDAFHGRQRGRRAGVERRRQIYYGRGNVTYRVSAQGGEPVAVTTPASNILQQAHRRAARRTRTAAHAHEGTPAQARIAVVGPDGGPAREILAGTMARYAATGHIVYATANGTLLAAPFDVRRLEVTGPSVPLVDGVAVDKQCDDAVRGVAIGLAPVRHRHRTGLGTRLGHARRRGHAG